MRSPSFWPVTLAARDFMSRSGASPWRAASHERAGRRGRWRRAHTRLASRRRPSRNCARCSVSAAIQTLRGAGGVGRGRLEGQRMEPGIAVVPHPNAEPSPVCRASSPRIGGGAPGTERPRMLARPAPGRRGHGGSSAPRPIAHGHRPPSWHCAEGPRSGVALFCSAIRSSSTKCRSDSTRNKAPSPSTTDAATAVKSRVRRCVSGKRPQRTRTSPIPPAVRRAHSPCRARSGAA